VRRLAPYLAALVLGLATALAIGCGADRSNLVPDRSAQTIKAQLAQIKQDIADGSCDGLSGKIDAVLRDAENLPGGVDKGLRSRINDGIRGLKSTAPEDCAAATQTDTQPTDTQPTDTAPPETTTQETTTQETTTTPPPTTTTPPATTGVPAPTEPPATTDTEPGADNGGTSGEVPAP
jgi:hypothetical protein